MWKKLPISASLHRNTALVTAISGSFALQPVSISISLGRTLDMNIHNAVTFVRSSHDVATTLFYTAFDDLQGSIAPKIAGITC